jgi:hypothetical protein
MTQLDLCKRALSEVPTRSTLTAIDDGSQEAYYLGLHYNAVRDQLLRAAHWNFAGRVLDLALWKALPGAQENNYVSPLGGWQRGYPDPPWIFGHLFPGDSLQLRYIVAHAGGVGGTPALPIFSGINNMVSAGSASGFGRFEEKADFYSPKGTPLALTQGTDVVTIAAGGSGYVPGELVTMTGGETDSPLLLQVDKVSSIGVVQALSVRRGLGYTVVPTNPVAQGATTGVGVGLTVNATWGATPSSIKVIVSNSNPCLMCYTHNQAPDEIWDPAFTNAFVRALAATVTPALTGDTARARENFAYANDAIIQARVRDGNEGLTVADSVPDWMRIRGVSSYGFTPYYHPYGPLFLLP